MVKTRSLYLTWAWIPIANTRFYALSAVPVGTAVMRKNCTKYKTKSNFQTSCHSITEQSKNWWTTVYYTVQKTIQHQQLTNLLKILEAIVLEHMPLETYFQLPRIFLNALPRLLAHSHTSAVSKQLTLESTQNSNCRQQFNDNYIIAYMQSEWVRFNVPLDTL